MEIKSLSPFITSIGRFITDLAKRYPENLMEVDENDNKPE
jgi:hypothetical protein